MELSCLDKNRIMKVNANCVLAAFLLLFTSCNERTVARSNIELKYSRYYFKSNGLLMEGEIVLLDTAYPHLSCTKTYIKGVEIKSTEYYSGDETITTFTTILNNPFPDVFARITLDSVSEGVGTTGDTYICFCTYDSGNINPNAKILASKYYTQFILAYPNRRIDYISVGGGDSQDSYQIWRIEEF